MPLIVDFCGEEYVAPVDRPFVIGREADLVLDDNPFLHRRFLQVHLSDDLWWLTNIGAQLAATVADAGGFVQAWLAPGASLPIVFEQTAVRFTAGQTSYEVLLLLDAPKFRAVHPELLGDGTTTMGALRMTPAQRLLILALAEPVLRSARGVSSLPSSADAAKRLGWTITRFNRKLDNVCERLASTGVRGLHGGPDRLASNRRARLVEYALAVRLVTAEDLPLLDGPKVPSDDE